MSWYDITALVLIQAFWFYLGYRFGKWYSAGLSIAEIDRLMEMMRDRKPPSGDSGA